jgi:Zn-dependent protease with chaperone function
MQVVAVPLLQAAILGWPAARLLARADWASRSPRAALRSWHACAVGVLVSLAAALIVTAHDLWEHGVVWLFHADLPLVHSAYGGTWQVKGVAEAALCLLVFGAVLLPMLTLYRGLRLRRTRDLHRLTADTQGLRDALDDPSVRILDHRDPAAFCIPGARGESRIVVTTAALDLLTGDQLSATVEHERAHLRRHDHRAILAADVVTAALGWTGMLAGYPEQVRRLAEMAADDEAAAKHGRLTVASALLEMGTPRTGAGPGAPGLPALSGSPAAERIRRLIRPGGTAAGRMLPRLATVTAALVLALPPAVLLAPAFLLADTARVISAP